MEQTQAEPQQEADFFQVSGRDRHTPSSRVSRALDLLMDMRLRTSARLRRLKQRQTPRRILIVGVEVPSRAGDLERIATLLSRSALHTVDVSTVRMQPMGKFANVDIAIEAAPKPLADYDWLIITDDDIDLPADFLDTYISIAEEANLAISQPAHRFRSYASYPMTRRRFGSLARSTRFVEIGPLTMLRSDTFATLIPFPDTRWCWGLDVVWSELAQRSGWTMGIVDGAPVGHLKPIAASYDSSEAVAEGRALLQRFGVTSSHTDVLVTAPLIEG